MNVFDGLLLNEMKNSSIVNKIHNFVVDDTYCLLVQI